MKLVLITVLPIYCLVYIAGASAGVQTQNIGRVIVYSGKVTVKGPQGSKTIEISGDVNKTESVQANEGTEAFLIIDGKTISLEPGKIVHLNQFESKTLHEDAVSRICRFIEIAFLPHRSQSSPLRHKGKDGENEVQLRILFPQNTGIIDFTPTFSWNKSGSIYEVSVSLAEGDQDRIWKKTIKNSNILIYPKDKSPLLSGKKYLWEVSDVRNAKEIDSGDFYIADLRKRTEVEDGIKKLHAACDSSNLPELSYILALSGFYEQNGFKYEAIQVLLNAKKQGIGKETITPILNRMFNIE